MLRTCFNDSWQVTDPTRFPSYQKPAVLDVRLPHDAMISAPRDENTGYTFQYGAFPGEDKLYIKKFAAPKEWQNKRVAVEFEGVYANATVYLNGNIVARQPYGYTRFLAKTRYACSQGAVWRRAAAGIPVRACSAIRG